MRLINIVHMADDEHDRLLAAGHPDWAKAVLERARRHLAEGERTGINDHAVESCSWRGNRAGWLLRMGDADAAEVLWHELLPAVSAGGWGSVRRETLLGLAQIDIGRGDGQAGATRLQDCIDCGEAPAAFAQVSQAHDLLAGLARARGDEAAAQACAGRRAPGSMWSSRKCAIRRSMRPLPSWPEAP